MIIQNLLSRILPVWIQLLKESYSISALQLPVCRHIKSCDVAWYGCRYWAKAQNKRNAGYQCQNIWELTQQDGRLTTKGRERLGMHSLAPQFFVILPSWVFQPTCCVSSLIYVLRWRPQKRPFSNSHGWTWTSMKWRLTQANLFKCKLIFPH